MKKLADRDVIPLEHLLGDRRGFVRTALLGAAGALLGIGCSSTGGAFVPSRDMAVGGDQPDLSTGEGPGPDLSMAPRPDLAPPRPDLTPPRPDLAPPSPDLAAACPATATDTAMAPATFTLGTATLFATDGVFVCRDAGGLYALTAVCTHNGCFVDWCGTGCGGATDPNLFRCPCHDSHFDFNGAVTQGPASRPLAHIALCLTATGTVAYDGANAAPSSQRYSF